MELTHSHPPKWEQELLRLALVAHPSDSEQHSHESARHPFALAHPANEHNHILQPSPAAQQGFALAKRVTRTNSKSFYLASGLLPLTKRPAVRVLYAFCRVTDDLVDKAEDSAEKSAASDLELWRAHALAACPPDDDVLLQAWHGVRAQYHIPTLYVRQLIDGIALDLTKTRYDTFEELTKYCYGVASTVGLMAMHIIGYRDRAAVPYAVKLGVALQLTNILRDIGEDFRQGRIYLPQEDLQRFRYTEQDLARGVIDERFKRLMDFEIARAKKLYGEAWDGIKMLSPDGRLAIAAAADLYRGILNKIVANNYDVFARRAHLSAVEKLSRLPSLWWNVRTMR